jgi:Patched family
MTGMAQHAASYPVHYAVLITLFSFGALAVGYFTNFELHVNNREQLTASKSRLIPEFQWMKGTFPQDPYLFSILVHRDADDKRSGDNPNLLTVDGIDHALHVVDMIQSTAGYQELCDAYAKDAITPRKAATRGGFTSLCLIQGVTAFWNHSLDAFNYERTINNMSDTDVILAVNSEFYPDGRRVAVSELFGQMTTHNSAVVKANAFRMTVTIPASRIEEYMDDFVEGTGNQVSRDLSLRLLDELLNLRQEWTSETPYRLQVMLYDYSIEQELVRAAVKDLPLIPFVFIIMAVFTCVVFSTAHKQGDSQLQSQSQLQQPKQQQRQDTIQDTALKGEHVSSGEESEGGNEIFHSHNQTQEEKSRELCRHSHQTRILLGIGAVVTILLSILTSYGLLWIIGVPFTNLTTILPFVLFGIGLDDSIIIFQAYVRRTSLSTDPSKDFVERIGDVMNEVSLGIFCAKLTTVLATSLAGYSNFPVLRWCSLYAFPAVVVEALYQVTLFIALLGLDERRIHARQRRGKLQHRQQLEPSDEQCSKPPSNKVLPSQPSDIHIELCEDCDHPDEKKGSRDPVDENEIDKDDQQQELEPAGSLHKAGETLVVNPSQKQPTHASAMDRFMHWYSSNLLKPAVRVFVLVIFAAITAGLIYCATQFRQGFDFMQLLPDDSYMIDFFTNMNSYGDGKGWLFPIVFFRYADQSDPLVQQQMEDYVDELVTTMDSIPGPPTYFWLRDFKLFLTFDDRLQDFDFNTQLGIFLSIPVFRILYGDDIVRDPESGEIIASRCRLDMNSVTEATVMEQNDIFKLQEAITASQPINAAGPAGNGTNSEDPWSFYLYEGSFYVWEFYGLFVSELIGTIVGGVVAVTVVGFLFIPHWTATLYLFPIMAVLCVDLIGKLDDG